MANNYKKHGVALAMTTAIAKIFVPVHVVTFVLIFNITVNGKYV